jgi:CRISPR/Cas system-associated endonuclease Cas1
MESQHITQISYRPRRVPLWLPYLQSIKETQKGVFEFVYNGGSVTTNIKQVSSIMIYGESDIKFDINTLENIARKGVPIIIHRRNVAQPIYIVSGGRPDATDTLTAQLHRRSTQKNKLHVARQILKAKFTSMSWLTPAPDIPRFTTIAKLRNIEAIHAKRYWKAYFTYLDHPELSRREASHIKSALDAQSKFLSGIILRWITYHHLSPFHGFLHETTDYPSLLYDLIEPYRGIFEKALLIHWKKNNTKPDSYLSSGIIVTKELLNEKCYVPMTRQIVTYQELLHGIVLSLKYYTLHKQRQFLIPMPGKPNGGRPPKINYLLYGRHAGKTDFWKEAKQVSGT